MEIYHKMFKLSWLLLSIHQIKSLSIFQKPFAMSPFLFMSTRAKLSVMDYRCLNFDYRLLLQTTALGFKSTVLWFKAIALGSKTVTPWVKTLFLGSKITAPGWKLQPFNVVFSWQYLQKLPKINAIDQYLPLTQVKVV